MKTRRYAYAATTLLMGLSMAQGASWSWTVDLDYPLSNPPPDSSSRLAWNKTADIPRFNESVHGTLLQVNITLYVTLHADLRAENTGASGYTLTFDYDGSVTLQRPNTAVLLSATVSYDNTFEASVYDEIRDWGGTSGVSFLNIIMNNSSSTTLTSPTDLDIFRGTGDVTLPVLARDALVVTGSPNVDQDTDTFGGARVTVEYIYVPEPAAWTAVVPCLLGAFALIRRLRHRPE